MMAMMAMMALMALMALSVLACTGIAYINSDSDAEVDGQASPEAGALDADASVPDANAPSPDAEIAGDSGAPDAAGPTCGDATCEPSETCQTCPADCGVCPVVCGDQMCDVSENPWDCSVDCGVPQIPAGFAGVVWLHTDVSGWAETATLDPIYINGGLICLDYDKTTVWPGLDYVGAFVNGNPWIFIYYQSTLYAATWEWLRHSQTCKNVTSVAGDHIKQDPFWPFQPQSGTYYGFMVSGLARDPTRNVYERSNVQLFQWP